MPTLTYGLHNTPNVLAAWGARMIFPAELVPDRTAMLGDPEAKKALLTWLETNAPQPGSDAFRAIVTANTDSRGTHDFTVYEDERGIIRASAQGSTGYLYVSGWLKAHAPMHEHDCTGCAYLGTLDAGDWYACWQHGAPTIIQRTGPDGEYRSGAAMLVRLPPEMRSRIPADLLAALSAEPAADVPEILIASNGAFRLRCTPPSANGETLEHFEQHAHHVREMLDRGHNLDWLIGRYPDHFERIGADDIMRDGAPYRDGAIAFLLSDMPSAATPGSRYGSDARECAPTAYALALCYADSSGDFNAETLGYCMGLVVNDSDDVASTLAEHGHSLRGEDAEHVRELLGRVAPEYHVIGADGVAQGYATLADAREAAASLVVGSPIWMLVARRGELRSHELYAGAERAAETVPEHGRTIAVGDETDCETIIVRPVSCDECSDDGPCELHGEAIVVREGASTYTADELGALLVEDCAKQGVTLTDDERALLDRARALLDRHAWIADEEIADQLRDLADSAVADLPDGLTVFEQDGYVITRIFDHCPEG